MSLVPRFGRFVIILAALSTAFLDAAAVEKISLDNLPVSEDYVVRKWELDDGLPNNHVSSTAQTPDGYLWIAMWWGGLARFDGVRFTEFTEGLGSERVQSLFVAKNGTLWVGLDRGGVARLKGNRFETVVPLGPIRGREPYTSSFAEDAEGAIWFTYSMGGKIYRWKNEQLSSFASQEGFISLRGDAVVHAEGNGRIWYQSGFKCGFFNGKQFEEVDPGNNKAIELAPVPGGGMWLAEGDKLKRYNPDSSTQEVAEIGWLGATRAVNLFYADHCGNLWIGTRSNGLILFRNGTFQKVPLSHSCVLSISEDREENLWVGTEGGLNRVRPAAFSLRQTRHGLHHDCIVSLCEDSEGRLWLAGRDGSPVRALDAQNRLFSTPPGWNGAGIMDLLPDPQGGVLMGMLGGLACWKDGAYIDQNLKELITALLADRRGNLWVSSIPEGLIRRGEVKDEKIPTGGGVFKPRALAEDAAGRIWVGTEAGLLFQSNQQTPPASVGPGSLGGEFLPVPLPGAKPGETVRFIVADQDNSVWIGTYRGGLYRWREGKMVHLPMDAGLPARDLRVLLIEPSGDFWFGTGRGLFRVARQEIEAAIEGRQKSMKTTAYGRNDGLPSLEFGFGFRNAAAQTRDGHLWFATYSGALEVNPQKLVKPGPAVPVMIESIQMGGTLLGAALAKGEKLTLPPHPGPVQIRYSLPHLSAPEQVQFRYRLIGANEHWNLGAGSSEAWNAIEGRRTVILERLLPGDYRFEVSAAEPNGPWLPAASVQFSVSAAWWETLWFKIVAGALGSVLLTLSVRFNVRRRMRARIRKLEQDHALERERARIARDMHDELGASLTQISIASRLARHNPPQEVLSHIDEIHGIARRTAASLDEIVWAVNPRNDTLSALLDYLAQYSSNFLRSAGIACQLEIPVDMEERPLDAKVRHHLFLAVKEALHNIAKHANAKSVHLSAGLQGDLLRVRVADDGSGFVLGQAEAGADGLVNMGARMEELGGNCRIESQPGQGTEIVFELTLPGGPARR